MLHAVLHLLLPPSCPVCGCAGDDAGLCAACLPATRALRLPRRGAVPLAPGVRAIGAFAYDGVIAAALRTVKAGAEHDAARGLGRLLVAELDLPPPGRGVAVTWVPASAGKLRARGVDVARLLAPPGATRLLRRVGERPDQTDLDHRARRTSPAGTFATVRAPPPAVVLVDDVRTTGATATAAALALRRAGARRVLVATLAVGGDRARAAAARAQPVRADPAQAHA